MGTCSPACCTNDEKSSPPGPEFNPVDSHVDVRDFDETITKSVLAPCAPVAELQAQHAKANEACDIGAAVNDSVYSNNVTRPTSQEMPLSCGDSKLEVKNTLKCGIAKIKELCVLGQFFEAHKSLVELEQVAHKNGAEDWAFDEQRRSDDAIVRLREWHKAWIDAIPIIKMSTRSDVKFVILEEAEPKAGPHVRIRVSARHLQNAERDPRGNSVQAVACQEMLNLPLCFPDFAARLIEADIIDKADLESCIAYSGFPGGASRFYRAYRRIFVSPVPFLKCYDDVISDFGSFPDPPPELAAYGPGIMHSDASLIDSLVDSEGFYDGFQILEKPRWGIRMTNVIQKYITPSKEFPGTSNLVIFCKLSAPAPQWLITEKLGAGILMNMAKGNAIKISKFNQDKRKMDRVATAQNRAPALYESLRAFDQCSRNSST